MKKTLLSILSLVALFTLPQYSFGQIPSLGTAASYAVFTSVGAFGSDGNTNITGNIGTNVGAFAGFPPGTVTGQTHVADATSAQVASDVGSAYGSLASVTCNSVLGVTMGSGQVITPNTYCTGAATSWVGNVTFDALNNPNAIFIIKIDGAFSTATGANAILANGASASNIYFWVSGAVSLGAGSTFLGTILTGGAISMYEGAFLQGRALSRAGAVALHNNRIIQASPASSACNCPR